MRMFANLKLSYFYSGVRTGYNSMICLGIFKILFLGVVIYPEIT